MTFESAAGPGGGFPDAFGVNFWQLAGAGEELTGFGVESLDPEALGMFGVLIEVGAVSFEAFGKT
jgi:hypothetical protein